MSVRLRNYRSEDFDVLWRLDQVCFEEGISYEKTELRHFLGMKAAFTLVAERADEKILGFIIAHRRRGGFGHVLTIDVDPAGRRHGVGTALLQGAHQRLRALGCHTMFLETAVNNRAALAFYERHGYAIVRTLPRYYQATGVDAFLMSAKLHAHETAKSAAPDQSSPA